MIRGKSADFEEMAAHRWVVRSELKWKTEGFILSAQDQSLCTRNYQANVIHSDADPKGRCVTKSWNQLITMCLVAQC